MLLIGTLFVLGFIVFAILSIISLIKRNGKFKRNAIITAISLVLFVIVANNNSTGDNVEDKEVETDEVEVEESKEDEKDKEKEVAAEQKEKKEQEEKERKKQEEKEKQEKQEKKEQEEKKKEKKEEKNKKFEIDKEIKIGKVTIDLQTVKVEDDELSVWAWWYHGATREKVHFSVLATLSVLQNGEYLDIVEGEDTFLRQTGYGVDSNLDVKYKLIDKDSPVEIRFRTTTDDPEEESVTIDIKE